MKGVYLLALVLAIGLTGCNKKGDKTSQTCSTTQFDCLYHDMLTNGVYTDDTTMDLEVHSYSFTVSAPHSIVQLGYQSLPGLDTTLYVLEIYDSTAATLLYSSTYTFSAAATSYVTLTPAVAVVPGHLYSVRRVQTNWGNTIAHTMGRVAFFYPKAYLIHTLPRTEGDLTVTSSAFYNVDSAANAVGQSRPPDNWYLPYIDLVFN